MTELWTGGCACGAVRYEGRGEPVRMLNCHCRDCQQASGSGYAAILTLMTAEVRITGELRWYERVAASGHSIARGFCPSCGSPVAVRPSRAPQVIGLQAGSLDDPSRHRPTADIFTGSAPPWDVMAEGTEKYVAGWRR